MMASALTAGALALAPAQMPAHPLAYRSLSHEWPAELRSLWHAARLAWGLCGALDAPAIAGATGNGRLADAAYCVWRDIELAAAPQLAAHESEGRQ